jgi:hypothetical protein
VSGSEGCTYAGKDASLTWDDGARILGAYGQLRHTNVSSA